MRRFMVLVTVALLTAAMLIVSMAPASAITFTRLIDRPSPIIDIPPTTNGTAVDAAVGEVLVEDSDEEMFEWRAGGVCWVNHPVSL